MKNKEKYLDFIISKTATQFGVLMKSNELVECRKTPCEECALNSKVCHTFNKGSIREWLEQEYELPLLDKVEREYLRRVIAPLRLENKDVKIIKGCFNDKYFIRISYCYRDDRRDTIDFPCFETSSEMYLGLEPYKAYSPEELELFRK